MSDKIDRIVFNAKSISGSGTRADNRAVKLFELETLEDNINEILSEIELSEEQQKSKKLLLASISELKSLSGENFRSQAMGLGNRVELFFRNVQEK